MPVRPVVSSDFAADNTFNGETYSIVRDTTPGAAAESPFLLLMNPSINSVGLNILRVTLVSISSLGSPTGVQNVFRFYTNPTITSNGTAQPINKQRVGGSNTTVMQAFSVPIVTSNGALIDVYSATSNGETSFDTFIDYTLVLTPGNNLLITVQGTVNGPSEVAVGIEWSEF